MTIDSFFSNPQNFSLTASGVAAQDLSPDSLYQLIQALEMPRSPLVDRYGKINIETGLAVLRARAHNLQHRESGHEDLIERINAIEGAIMPQPGISLLSVSESQQKKRENIFYSTVGVAGGATGCNYLQNAHGHTDASQQQMYLQAANAVVMETARKILIARTEGSALVVEERPGGHETLFSELLSDLSKVRSEIERAKNEGIIARGQTPSVFCEAFGKSRLSRRNVDARVFLGGHYAHAGLICVEYMIRRIKEDKELWCALGLPEDKFVEPQRITDSTEEINGLSVSVEWHCFTPDSVISQNDSAIIDAENSAAIKVGQGEKPLDRFRFYLPSNDPSSLVRYFHQKCAVFRENFPDQYKAQRRAVIVDLINKDLIKPILPDLKISCFVSFVVKYLIDESPIEDPVHLTDITGWINVDPELSPEVIFENMKKECFPLLYHQDCMDMEITLLDAEIYFNKAMEWKEAEGLAVLKQHVGCMMYLLAHNHRDIRGTAAESEWLERAIYAALGFKFSAATPLDREPDLYAFSTPGLVGFMKRYLNSFDLVPKVSAHQDQESL